MKKLVMFLSLAGAMMAQKPMPVIAPTGHVQGADVDLAYWTYGAARKATPVFAVNGGPGLSHIYMVQNDVWLQIAKQRQVVFYDQRGTGASPLKNAGAAMDIAAYVADLDAVREHLHIDKIDLCGDSFGGLLVIAYAAAHPEHVHKLIVSDGVPGWKPIVHLFPQVFPDKLEEQEKAGHAHSAGKDEAGQSEADAQQALRDHFGMIFYSRTKLDRYMQAKDLGFSPKTGAAVGKATQDVDYSDALTKFNFPTLIITGRYDMNVAPLTAWKMYKAIPGAKFEVFEESGHLPSYEEPEKYVRVVNDFLGRD
jgi:proline iminopeptidase